MECFTESSQSEQLVTQLVNLVDTNMFANELPMINSGSIVIPEQFNYSSKI